MTSLGGGDAAFPPTAWSVVLAAGDPRHPAGRAALESLVERYWKPAYIYLRFEWTADNERAKDLTQAFFASILERGVLGRIEREGGRFRSFLRTALSNFAKNVLRDERAAKRGGARAQIPFEDALGQPGREEDPARSAEEAFDRVWRREVLERALAAVESELVAAGREREWRAFEAVVLAEDRRPTYDEVARRLGAKTTDITNWLHATKKRMKSALRRILVESLADPADLEDEWRAVLGRGPGE